MLIIPLLIIEKTHINKNIIKYIKMEEAYLVAFVGLNN